MNPYQPGHQLRSVCGIVAVTAIAFTAVLDWTSTGDAGVLGLAEHRNSGWLVLPALATLHLLVVAAVTLLTGCARPLVAAFAAAALLGGAVVTASIPYREVGGCIVMTVTPGPGPFAAMAVAALLLFAAASSPRLR